MGILKISWFFAEQMNAQRKRLNKYKRNISHMKRIKHGY